MALPPTLRALQLGSASAPNVLEVYVDFVCPFSRKQVLGLRDHVLPLLPKGEFKLILRPYVQPWHWPSTLTSEGALAVARLASRNPPEQLAQPSSNAFWLFAVALFDAQEDFFEAAARNKSADQVRSELTHLAVGLFGGGGQGHGTPSGHVKADLLSSGQSGVPLGQAIKDLLNVKPEGNAGNALQNEVKYAVRLLFLAPFSHFPPLPAFLWVSLCLPAAMDVHMAN